MLPYYVHHLKSLGVSHTAVKSLSQGVDSICIFILIRVKRRAFYVPFLLVLIVFIISKLSISFESKLNFKYIPSYNNGN